MSEIEERIREPIAMVWQIEAYLEGDHYIIISLTFHTRAEHTDKYKNNEKLISWGTFFWKSTRNVNWTIHYLFLLTLSLSHQFTYY